MHTLAERLPLTLLLTLPVLLTGCGQGSGASDTADEGRAADQWRDCTVAAFEAADGEVRRVATMFAEPTQVKLPSQGPCAGGLVTLSGSGVHGLDVSDLDLDPATLRVVRAKQHGGSADLVRVDGGAHPRGGFQPHLFRASAEVHEITLDDQPLIPFVATDGGMAPMTVRCGDDGTVEVLSATTSEPPGVVLAWDVEQTTYDVGEPVREVGTEQLREHAADPVLRGDLPALFDPQALFANC